VANKQAEILYNAIQKTKIIAPSTDCLAPIGVEQILSGMHKELQAEFYTAITRKPTVYRGNPFAVEVGLAFGGKLPRDELARCMRFANRVPLLYQQSGCCIFKAIVDTNWKNYGLQQSRSSLPSGPLVIMVHLASVWVPFTNESKEAIADYDVIRNEISLAIKDCGRKLGIYTRKRNRAADQAKRRDIFTSYIDVICDSVHTITCKNTATLKKQLVQMARDKTELANLLADQKDSNDANRLEKDSSVLLIEENVLENPGSPDPQGSLFDDLDSTPPAPPRKRSRGGNSKKKTKRRK
jgi:DNA topoisomerase-6 subunit B